ncbi:high affinity cAMP-specific and IBMX-insensitive 3',5'-cyclic phosphodiesterase 8 isoform X4 [Apis dorsata]|uniref:high affinity cAMP-specific and IBMX-insensitive 3',5'-cyclic phosphodiesterase 8 isoform X4 n=1 Tax=Apis dorsata TaxID=7462 RepID=UPI0012933502|nr:high affinity cAMP-specific and IBMX-insensitive 3',5'-cyclic phosphodiesterase 8 isoform X4 [Apis dorsata]
MGCKSSVLEYVEDTGEKKRKESDMEQGFLFEKTEYDILRRKSSFEDVDDEKNADYSTLIGSHDTEPHPLTNSIPSLIKILLVFPKDDQQMDILATTSRRLGWSVSVAKDAEKALEFFQARGHELVIIDHRGHRAAEADIICRAIRASPLYYNSIIIALVKKSYLMHSESEKIVTLDLMEIGYTKVSFFKISLEDFDSDEIFHIYLSWAYFQTLMECAHERILINELVGIYTSGILPRTQLVAANMLYIALDRCRDMIHVTNDKYIIQFANKISEKLLGYRINELWGKNITDLILYDNFIQMEQHIIKGREYDGNLNCIRRNNQMITINCRVIPFAYFKKPTHYIFIFDTTYLSENIQPLLQPTHPKTVVITQKRISEIDFKGIQEVRRRLSKRDLQTLQLEAPITKVIGLLTASIKEDTSSETKEQIEKAIDILKTTELYSPVFKEQGDPAAEFIEALITPKKSWDIKKPSVESIRETPSKTLAASTRMQIKGYRGPQEIAEILQKCLEWDFDIFKLEILTEKRALLFLGMTIMNLFRVPARLGCEEKIVQNWLIVIEANYDSMNRYHNSTHAADVLQATAIFMQTERLKQVLEPLDEVAALIAAAAHDIDHPGRSSQFLCNSDNKLAILYNDLTVLESHHAALTFKLSLSDDNVNIFKNLERDTYKQLRQSVIDMILATEMTKHFEHLAKFMNAFSTRIPEIYIEGTQDIDVSTAILPENIILVKRMIIKCADVSNPTRPLKYCVEWARRIAEEYFSQTDEEKQLHLPVMMPMFDRITCSIPRAQIGFIDFIINDMVEAWDVFINMPEIVGFMRQNYDKWKEYNEKGITTLQDIEKIQEAVPELKIYSMTT